MRPDRFEVALEPGAWVFTVVLGLAAGLVAAGAFAWWRNRERPWPALLLVVGGVALGVAVGMSAFDRSPYHPVNLRLKPYLGSLAEAGALAGALLAGVVATALVVFGASLVFRRRRPGVTGALISIGTVALAGAGLLALVQSEVSALHHPEGTDTSATVGSTLLIDSLELPTGLAIGADGTVVVTQLLRPVLTLLAPHPGAPGFERLEIPLPVPEGGQVFHVVLHPNYPEVPVAYVSAEQQRDGVGYLEVLRVRLVGGGDVATVIEALPIEQTRFSNHSGSAMAICGGYFYLSTGDTDPYADPARTEQRLSIRIRAQIPGAPEGKILRYRLSGTDLIPDGIIASDPPVYAMGFRNVFGMGCDAETGNPIAADNGPTALDQLRIVAPGSNHEWPLSETRAAIAPPLFSTGRAVIAPTGVVSRAVPAGHEAIVSAYESQSLYLLPYADGTAAGPLRLLTEVEGGAYAVAIDSKGCVLYSGPTAVWRLDEPACTP